MKIKIAWIGKTKEVAIAALTEEYLKRIARYVQVEGVALRDEAALLEMCGRSAGTKSGVKSTLVLMDSRCKEFSSEQFAKFAAVVFSPVPAAVRPMVRLLFARQTRGQLRGQGLGRLGVGEQREKFRSAMDWLDSMVDGQFLCGAELSVADVAVAAQVGALNIPFTPVAEAEIHAHAKVMRWLERTSEALG